MRFPGARFHRRITGVTALDDVVVVVVIMGGNACDVSRLPGFGVVHAM